MQGPRGPRPVARVGPFVATLLNGVFGDPLVHVRVPHRKRSLVVDFGEGAKLPARTAHQVTDVFISHAHVDHIAGFLPFLRSRIGVFPICRVFGPPGLSDNIAGFVSGIHWDRVGPRAPRFEIAELHGERLLRFDVSAGRSRPRRLGEETVSGGVVFADAVMVVHATVLDHLTPVLAFALESKLTINVRKERLMLSGLQPGPWLADLKDCVAAGRLDAPIGLPSGDRMTAGGLADEFLIVRPGEKLVYATDLADTESNRVRLQSLAREAHTFFCEAAFCEAEAAQARRTGHLTTRACAEIAVAAGAQRLVPFHFSRRYESDPARVYRELSAVCQRTIVPPEFMAAE